MKKFSKDTREQLIALMLYHLFKRSDGLDAYCIADQIGATKLSEADSLSYEGKENCALRAWTELGSKVNFCVLERKGELSVVLASLYDLQQLREKNRDLYQKNQILRKKASQRWSSDWKTIQPKIIAAQSLHGGKPKQESLTLTWQSVQAYCARKLEQASKQEEAKQLQNLSLKELSISASQS